MLKSRTQRVCKLLFVLVVSVFLLGAELTVMGFDGQGRSGRVARRQLARTRRGGKVRRTMLTRRSMKKRSDGAGGSANSTGGVPNATPPEQGTTGAEPSMIKPPQKNEDIKPPQNKPESAPSP